MRTKRNDPQFDQVRREVDARQRSILWEDGLRNGKNFDAFLWHGDPRAKPIQRAGLLVFSFMFLLLSMGFFCIPFQEGPHHGNPVPIPIAVILLFVALRLFRNALLRLPRQHDKNKTC